MEYFRSGLSITELQSKHFYIHANALQQEISFVYQGLLRAFYVDEKGNEITVNFVRENRYALKRINNLSSIYKIGLTSSLLRG